MHIENVGMVAWYFHGRTVSYLLLYLYYGRLICSMQTIYYIPTPEQSCILSFSVLSGYATALEWTIIVKHTANTPMKVCIDV